MVRLLLASGEGATLTLTAVQAGAPFTVTESDSNIAKSTVVANGSVRYTPNADYNGNDSFTYTRSEQCGSAEL